MTNKLGLDDNRHLQNLWILSIKAGIKKLCERGVWPRPINSRVLHVGADVSKEDFKDMRELNLLVDFLASQEPIRKMYLNEKYHSFSRRVLVDYWLRFLLNILTETEGIEPPRPVLKKWFNRFWKELFSDTAVWRAIYVFDGVELNGNQFKLDEFTTVMPITKAKLESLIPWHDKYFRLSEVLNEDETLSPSGNAILIVTKRIHKDYKGLPWPSGKEFRVREPAFTALAAIRLTQPGSVYMRYWGEFQVSDFPVLEPIGMDTGLDFGLRFYEKKVIIQRGDFSKIQSVWKKLMNEEYAVYKFKRQNPPSAIEIARNRFLKSYEDEDWYESLLDLAIAQEALFSPSDNQELRHRIALRSAWLLQTNQNAYADDQQTGVFDVVQRLYDIRSFIVHGSRRKPKDIKILIRKLAGEPDSDDEWHIGELAVETARDIVRRSIEACSILAKLPNNGPHWPFDNSFDRLMVIPGQQQRWQKAAGVLKS